MLSLFLLTSCDGPPSATPPSASPEVARPDVSAPATDATPSTAADSARGGRYFDRWWRYDPSFSPDDSNSPEPDGKGGPHGDGTLTLAGAPATNSGHDFRLKNYFGWDLRGQAGVYGPDYQNKAYAVDVDLLADDRSFEELHAWLAAGDESIPAFGDVLSEEALADIATFIIDTRERRLPHPEQIFTLSKDAPNNYVLNEGANLEAGHAAVEKMCSGGFCHGVGGNAIAIDGTYSLGSYSRAKGYEAWFKIVNGQPGTGMGRQTDDAQEVLDILAALCDRTVYPPEEPDVDVPDGDPRCGAYLR